jgi:hypothetical protein
MWHSRRIQLLIAGAAVATFVLVLVVTRGGHGATQVRAADSSTSSASTTTTTTAPPTTTTTTAPPETTTAPPETTTTAKPAPPTTGLPAGNKPMTIKVTATHTTISNGDTITLTATMTDPDAPPRPGCVQWSYDSGYGPFIIGTGSNCPAPDPACDGAPSAKGGTATDSITWTANGSAGDVTFYAYDRSHEPSCTYDSKATGTLVVHVTG